jgi:hypothetical protein
MAAQNGAEDMVKLLLEQGADYTLTDNDGCTPEQLARRAYPRLAKMIPKYRKTLKIAQLNDVINKQNEEMRRQQTQIEKLQAELEEFKQQNEIRQEKKRAKLNTS